MTNKYNEMAARVIESAKAVIAGGRAKGHTVDVSHMSEIGKAIVGKVNDFAFSPEVQAAGILKDGWVAMGYVCDKLEGAEYAAASAAQDSIAEFALTIGVEI